MVLVWLKYLTSPSYSQDSQLPQNFNELNMSTAESVNEKLLSLFRQASRLMTRGRRRPEGIHPAQGRILFILAARGSMSRREMIELLGLRSGSLSELLNKLEKSGYIARRRDEDDKRGFILEVTEDGRAVVSGHENWRRTMSDRLFAVLSEEEGRQLGIILTKLAAAWEMSFESTPLDDEMEGCRGHHRLRGREVRNPHKHRDR